MKTILVLSMVMIVSLCFECRHDEIQKKTKIFHTPLNDRYCRFRKRCNRSRRLRKDGDHEMKYPLTPAVSVVTNSGIPVTIMDKESKYSL